MAIVVLKPGYDVDELRRRGMPIYKCNGQLILRSQKVKKDKEESLNEAGKSAMKCFPEIFILSRYKMNCPHCGNYMDSMSAGLSMGIKTEKCSRKRCQKPVSGYELFTANEATVKSFIMENYKPTKKIPVIDPDVEFARLLKEVDTGIMEV